MELDCYRVQYGNISSRVLSAVSHARNSAKININQARSFISSAYQELTSFADSEFKPSNQTISGLLKHINRAERWMHVNFGGQTA